MDFGNQYLMLLFEWNGIKVYLTSTLLATWVVMAILIVLAVVVRLRLRSFTEVPSGVFQNVVETAVEMMDSLANTMMGPQLAGFNAYFFGIFAFILMSNYIGLFGLRPPTADIATTFALALSVFLLIHITGIVRAKGAYFKSYFQPTPIFFPLNIIGELSKPISLGFRLFGNILGGVIIMGLIYEMLPLALNFILPSVLHIYFDIFVGALQAFIFTVLSMTFIRQKVVFE